ncbi:MAG: uroporphyrinogen decarboxylase family protein [Planctomycetaceae bacterium]|nr:hypothetical protein [Planctomycetaceae bacterium]
MENLTTHERFKRMYAHQQADRVPIVDHPWESTLMRWQKEGLTTGWREHFGLDNVVAFGGDTSPRFDRVVIEETDSYIIERDAWGITKKNFKPTTSTPLDMEFAIHDPDTWAEAKKRLTPTRDRMPWDWIKTAFPQWRKEGAWIVGSCWFGYDIVNARMVGTENVLYGMADNPEWVKDMLDTLCDLGLELMEMAWQEGYHFDELQWYDDMGYRNGMLFSKAMWREIVRPYQQRTIDWAHSHGIVAQMHSCGNIMEIVPELVELGLDALNPFEVKAGMDILGVKRRFGDRLTMQGGFDVRNWESFEIAEAELRAKLPELKKNGGYIFGSDHSIPHHVSLDTMSKIVALVKDIGSY